MFSRLRLLNPFYIFSHTLPKKGSRKEKKEGHEMQPNQTENKRKSTQKNRGPKFDLSGSSFMQTMLAGIAAVRIAATQPPTKKEN